jgi:hypothetical protein
LAWSAVRRFEDTATKPHWDIGANRRRFLPSILFRCTNLQCRNRFCTKMSRYFSTIFSVGTFEQWVDEQQTELDPGINLFETEKLTNLYLFSENFYENRKISILSPIEN